MQATPHVHAVHIDDGSVAHPGGSNNYFVGDPDEGMVLIDAGDQQRAWTQMILDYHLALGRPRITSILVTHGHGDHVGGLDRIQEALEAPVRCHPRLAGRLDGMLGDGIVVPFRSRETVRTGGGCNLRALFTPGHSTDHVCFHLARDGVLFTGDTVLGGSSSTVRDLAAYMKSLSLLTRFRYDTICPAHGPVVPPPRGRRLVQWYIDHRDERERQVLEALRRGIATPEEIAREIYPRNLRRGLREAAEGNVRTHLDKLVQEGRVRGETSFTLTD